MHILTKVLVLFAAVLSIFLSALTIAYSANADRILADYTNEKNGRAAAEASAAASAAQMNNEKGTLTARIEQLARDKAETESRVRTLQAENANLLTEKANAEAARQAIGAKIAEWGETAKTQAALIGSYREEVTKLRANELRYREQTLSLEDRISDLEAQGEVLEQNFRAVQEQLAEAKLALDAAKTGAATPGAGQAAEAFVYTGPRIPGRVDEIRKDDASGTLLAKISVGSNDQVKPNMKFYVVRGDQFIANLVVIQTDLQYSIGRVDTLGRDVEIVPGDRVLSRLQ